MQPPPPIWHALIVSQTTVGGCLQQQPAAHSDELEHAFPPELELEAAAVLELLETAAVLELLEAAAVLELEVKSASPSDAQPMIIRNEGR